MLAALLYRAISRVRGLAGPRRSIWTVPDMLGAAHGLSIAAARRSGLTPHDADLLFAIEAHSLAWLVAADEASKRRFRSAAATVLESFGLPGALA